MLPAVLILIVGDGLVAQRRGTVLRHFDLLAAAPKQILVRYAPHGGGCGYVVDVVASGGGILRCHLDVMVLLELD